ncbi:MAG TPA: thioesterase domain-containing protein [Bryobacteraceae bacterium]|jgi:surfactin synthase thioesterase subunit/glycosyltransferase involved in cell wall biosynthesis|nr:thioesterase domain-containing protein [Bryobacteraceae bacterium]
MRILLAHNSLYYPSFGGGDKSNRLLMEALAARGHEVRVVARLTKFEAEENVRFIADLEARGIRPEASEDAVRFVLNGVDVRTLTLNPQLRAYFAEQLSQFDPDVIVTSTDDPAQLLFEIASRAARARVVYLVRATIAVPFGPDSSSPNPARAAMLRHADGIVGVSEYVAGYVRQWSGVDAIHIPISLLEPGEVQQLGRFENPYVVTVNPCAVKGISVFLALAERAPHLEFAAVPTWGTNARDLARLRRQPNISVLDPVENLDDLFRRARVLLVPSLWAEARSRVVLEAMLRGIPVMASDMGGLKEAKLGVPYLLPVNPITQYQSALDENMVPVAAVPEQDIGPWLATLRRLTEDREHWEEIAAQSRTAALNYASTLTVEPFERFLMELVSRPKRQLQVAPPLSDDKRRLLALRLRRRAWFPTLQAKSPDHLRLFCFPHAGGGVLAYRKWIGALPGVEVIPVLLPGRETRLAEAPLESMRELIATLTPAIRPFVNVPCAFFGHSMGAGIAFELTRSLRAIGAPLPRILIVSSARAPQDRTEASRQKEPSDAELTEELAGLGALTQEALELAFPILRADSRLYRNYVYRPEAPLAIPIAAYGGASDASIGPKQLDRWHEQTTASFIRREFEGGHFYLQSNPDAVLEFLRRDLDASPHKGG